MQSFVNSGVSSREVYQPGYPYIFGTNHKGGLFSTERGRRFALSVGGQQTIMDPGDPTELPGRRVNPAAKEEGESTNAEKFVNTKTEEDEADKDNDADDDDSEEEQPRDDEEEEEDDDDDDDEEETEKEAPREAAVEEVLVPKIVEPPVESQVETESEHESDRESESEVKQESEVESRPKLHIESSPPSDSETDVCFKLFS